LNDVAWDLLDEQLHKARSGEQAALTALVKAHQRSVYSLALRMLGTPDLAEDLTQDVFVLLNENLSSMESSKHLAFWLRQVTTRRAIDQLRRRARVEMTSLDSEAQLFSTQDAGDPLLQRHLRQLLSELSAPARAVLLLRFQEDLDPIDIARTLDMPINTVKSHLKRSLDAMREKTREKTLDMQSGRCEDNPT
jgi:RNA polymerase sigma-70 factor (ECF subfamily)